MVNIGRNISIFSGNANPELAMEIGKYLGVPLGEVEISRFPDSEILVRYCQNIRGTDVFIIQPTCAPPNENLMELLIMLDAAKRASASRITAVIPFYGYARQDRKDRPRVPVTAKLVADLLTTAGASRILTMDLHSQQIQGFFNIPVDHLYAAPVLIPYLRKKLKNSAVVVAPDLGSVKMAQAYSNMLDSGFAVVAKRRVSAVSVESLHLVGDVKGRECILIDDLTSTAGTLVEAAVLLKNKGAESVFAAVSHCLLNEIGRQRLIDSCIEELITTNGVPVKDDCNGKIKVLSVAKLLGEAIKRIHESASVSSLFKVSLGRNK